MTESERRDADAQATWELKRKLNVVQLAALNSLERFGWYLKFVRHNPPPPAVEQGSRCGRCRQREAEKYDSWAPDGQTALPLAAF